MEPDSNHLSQLMLSHSIISLKIALMGSIWAGNNRSRALCGWIQINEDLAASESQDFGSLDFWIGLHLIAKWINSWGKFAPWMSVTDHGMTVAQEAADFLPS